jgi:multiple sugar transport system substrate-binding protein
MKEQNLLRKFAILILVILLLLVCLDEKSLAKKEEEAITIWAMGAEGMKIAEMARKFEQANPGVKVITQAIPWEAAHEKLITSVVGEIPPDVSQLGTTWMAEFQAMGALAPLDELISNSRIISKDKFFPASWETNLVEERVYGIPWYVDTRVMFYRKDLLKEVGFNHPPRTWEELERVGKALVKDRDGDGKTDQYGMALPVKDWNILSMFIWENGGNILTPDNSKPDVESEATQEAFQFYLRLFEEKIVPTTEAVDVDLFHAFRTGFYPIFISGPWMIELVGNELGKEYEGKWDVAMMPRKKFPTSFVGGCNLVVFKGSKHKEAAWKFIEFMSQPDIQVEWYRLTTDLPAVKSAWQDPFFNDKPMLRVFGEQLNYTKAPPSIPEWEQIADAMQRRMEELILGKMNLFQTLGTLTIDINEILGKKESKVSKGRFFLSLGAILVFIWGLAFLWKRFRRKVKEMEVPQERISALKRLIVSLKKYHAPYLFIIPSLTILFVFLFLPVIISFIMSLTDWDIYGLADWKKISFVGLGNYQTLLRDTIFWRSLFNTFYFVIVGVPFSISLALLMAVILNEEFIKFKSFFRASYFAPVVTTLVAVAVVWRWLYNPDYGLINWTLQTIGLPSQNWLGDTKLAMPCLIIMAAWKNFGYNMVIFLAGLQAIPDSLYDAAKVDGASYWQRFRYVTLPGLKPTTFFVTVTTMIGFFQFFAEPYIMTKGGPLNSTISVVLHMYNQGFKFFRMGYASAIGYILFGIIVVFTILQVRFQKAAYEGV